MQNQSVNDGMTEGMAALSIDKAGGGKNEAVIEIMDKLNLGHKKKQAPTTPILPQRAAAWRDTDQAARSAPSPLLARLAH